MIQNSQDPGAPHASGDQYDALKEDLLRVVCVYQPDAKKGPRIMNLTISRDDIRALQLIHKHGISNADLLTLALAKRL